MKTHLNHNKNYETRGMLASCATDAYAPKARRNSRSSYQGMSSPIVVWDTYKTLPSDQRCAHCDEAALIIRNRQRKDKGLPPVASLFD